MGDPQMASPLGLPKVGEDVWTLLTLASDVTEYSNVGISSLCCGSQVRDGFAKGKYYYFIVKTGP